MPGPFGLIRLAYQIVGARTGSAPLIAMASGGRHGLVRRGFKERVAPPALGSALYQ
jgi:hypothetical protein